MPVTALYAGFLAPLFVLLALRVISQRRGARVALGDGSDKALLRRMRVHANFAEYVPLSLVLMGLAESLATNAWLLHGAGITLVAGRAVHAFGVSRAQEDLRFRVSGMAATFTVVITLALACLSGSLSRLMTG